MTYITNAFSIQMLSTTSTIEFTPITVEDAHNILNSDNYVCGIGHADTAAVVTNLLGLPFEANRVNISLSAGDTLVVAQLTGGRLPEGATTLPEGFAITFWKVIVK